MAVNRSLVLYPRFADHGVRRGAVYQSPPYNHTDAWRTLLRTHRNDIAAAMKIPPEDFRWYAAFHDEGNHPHVHMMAWSAKPNQAYLSKDGIRQIKSTLTNQIFRQELLHVYEQKSKSRDELVAEADLHILHERYMNRMKYENRHPVHMSARQDRFEDFKDYVECARKEGTVGTVIKICADDFSYRTDEELLQKIDCFMKEPAR